MKPELKIDYATHKAAKFACENWHYSKTIPVPPLVKFSVYENNKFIGCIIFSRGASSNISKPFGLEQIEVCELTRVALKKHESNVSKMVSIAIKMLRKQNPKIKIIVSYADPNNGHNGSIYQALNFIYIGETAKTNKYYDKTGKMWHSRQVSEKGYNIQYGERVKALKPSELLKCKEKGKYKYVYPLDSTMKEFCLKLSKPYPKKCVGGVESDTSGVHPEEGGALPTPTLIEELCQT